MNAAGSNSGFFLPKGDGATENRSRQTENRSIAGTERGRRILLAPPYAPVPRFPLSCLNPFLCSWISLFFCHPNILLILQATADIYSSSQQHPYTHLDLSLRLPSTSARSAFAASMSLPAAFPFYLDKNDPTFSFPSPPPSIISDLDFDIDSFTHCSPGPFDDLSGLSPITTSTPSSTTLVSPKLSIADVSTLFSVASVNNSDAAEALSNHHLERYLHYKTLAAQAEVEAQVQQNEQIDALLAKYSMPDANPLTPVNPMLGYQVQPPAQYGQQTWNASFLYPPQESAAIAHAQAQAHMQAHDAAMAQAQYQRSMNYYMPNIPRVSMDTAQQALWSRQSVSSVVSTPYPSTPAYNVSPVNAIPMGKPGSSPPAIDQTADQHIEGENEITDEASENEDDSEDVKPVIAGSPILNSHRGGRGYVPGKTPDDPKKRHKCDACGRGFARAFNLKVSKFHS